MITTIEFVIFFTLTFGALGGLSYLIAEFLAERGIWPLDSQKPRPPKPVEAFNTGR